MLQGVRFMNWNGLDELELVRNQSAAKGRPHLLVSAACDLERKVPECQTSHLVIRGGGIFQLFFPLRVRYRFSIRFDAQSHMCSVL